VLGLPSTAPYEQVKKRYYELARQEHPDLSSDPAAAQKMADLTEAYEVLANEQKRENYDRLAIIAKTTGRIPSFLFAVFVGLVAWHFQGGRERKKAKRVGGVAISTVPAANIQTWQKLDSRPMLWGSTAHMHTVASANQTAGWTRTTMLKHVQEDGSTHYVGPHMIRVIPLSNTTTIADMACTAQLETVHGKSFTVEVPGLTTSLEEIETAAAAAGWSPSDVIEHVILCPNSSAHVDGLAAAAEAWGAHKNHLYAFPFRKKAAHNAYLAALDAANAADRGTKAVKWAKLKAVAKEMKRKEARALARLELSVDGVEKRRAAGK
jgi:hypothetical protein